MAILSWKLELVNFEELEIRARQFRGKESVEYPEIRNLASFLIKLLKDLACKKHYFLGNWSSEILEKGVGGIPGNLEIGVIFGRIFSRYGV